MINEIKNFIPKQPNQVIHFKSAQPLDRVEIAAPQHAQAGVHKKWLVLNYVAADCNLQAFQMSQMDEQERVGSDTNTHIVAQIDRGPMPKGDVQPSWKNCQRWYIKHDETPKELKSDKLEDLGPTNMSKYEVLRGFLTWGMTNFPADHVLVILNDHGRGTDGAISDDTEGGTMSVTDLARAFQEAEEITKQKVDIVSFDACLMATTEVGYEFKDRADFLLASEETEGGDGWSYKPMFEEKVVGGLKFLQESLGNRLTVTPKELAVKIVEVNQGNQGDIPTFSATDLSKMDTVKEATDNLAELIIKTAQTQKKKMRTVVDSAQYFTKFWTKDHADIAKKISKAIADGKIKDQDGKLKEACEQVIDVIQGNKEKGIEPAVFKEEHEEATYPGATGLTIQSNVSDKYDKLAFGKDSKWKAAMEAIGDNLSFE